MPQPYPKLKKSELKRKAPRPEPEREEVLALRAMLAQDPADAKAHIKRLSEADAAVLCEALAELYQLAWKRKIRQLPRDFTAV